MRGICAGNIERSSMRPQLGFVAPLAAFSVACCIRRSRSRALRSSCMLAMNSSWLRPVMYVLSISVRFTFCASSSSSADKHPRRSLAQVCVSSRSSAEPPLSGWCCREHKRKARDTSSDVASSSSPSHRKAGSGCRMSCATANVSSARSSIQHSPGLALHTRELHWHIPPLSSAGLCASSHSAQQ
eukprot:scaffold41824_cov69-Phaeocystis_antarctica.AAC.3